MAGNSAISLLTMSNIMFCTVKRSRHSRKASQASQHTPVDGHGASHGRRYVTQASTTIIFGHSFLLDEGQHEH